MVFFKQLSYINFLKNKTFRSLKIMHAKNNGEGLGTSYTERSLKERQDWLLWVHVYVAF